MKLDVQFDRMVTPVIIKILYVAGIVLIPCCAILLAVTASLMPFATGMTPVQGKWTGLALLIFGPLLWRMACEQGMLLYKIREHLTHIDQRLRTVEPQQAPHEPGAQI